jgi:hypothetical protein
VNDRGTKASLISSRQVQIRAPPETSHAAKKPSHIPAEKQWCSGCSKVKLLADFGKGSRICKECRKTFTAYKLKDNAKPVIADYIEILAHHPAHDGSKYRTNEPIITNCVTSDELTKWHSSWGHSESKLMDLVRGTVPQQILVTANEDVE